jgi:hypothetical protein
MDAGGRSVVHERSTAGRVRWRELFIRRLPARCAEGAPGEVADVGYQALVRPGQHVALPFTGELAGEMGVGEHGCLLPLWTRPGSSIELRA